jgi:zinc transport system substrate-binding protein
LDDRLAALDRELEAQLAPLQQRRFLALHPAWGYFAERYRLEQVAVQGGDKEPGPRRLAELVTTAREQGIGLMVVQPQHDIRTAEVVARELDIRLVSVDPLDPDLFAALRHLVAALTGKLS